MQQPSAEAFRVPHQIMQRFLYDVAIALGIPVAQATLLAQLLVESDLRGVLSHGSRLIPRYHREIATHGINPTPAVKIVRETSNSVTVDGDGGLGYFPAQIGMQQAIEKAKQHGMSALVTRNHGHIGAAGIYTRMTLKHDLLCFVTSGVRLKLNPGDPIIRAAGASPMSFSAPGMHETSLVLDCGVTHDVQADPPHLDELIALTPGLVTRAIGFGTICQTWGGLLTGLCVNDPPDPNPYPAANQGAMMYMFRIDLFAEVDNFKREVDRYVQATKKLTPLPGQGALLPGGPEAEREQAYRRDGIPLSGVHRQQLEQMADELGVAKPW